MKKLVNVHALKCKLKIGMYYVHTYMIEYAFLFIDFMLLYNRCGRVVTDFDWEAKNRFNF